MHELSATADYQQLQLYVNDIKRILIIRQIKERNEQNETINKIVVLMNTSYKLGCVKNLCLKNFFYSKKISVEAILNLNVYNLLDFFPFPRMESILPNFHFSGFLIFAVKFECL